MIVKSLVISSVFLPLVWSGCPFQNPFFFIDQPSVVTVVDSQGEMVADRVRVSWGQLENFKCVDYFQLEYYQQSDPVGTAKLSGKINRHRHSHDIDIKPCSDYLFKVIASEDWKGMREDFRMASDTISFRVDYTPKFKRPPVVKERRVRVPRPSRTDTAAYRERRAPLFEEVGKTPTPPPPPPEPEVPYNVWISWHLSYIDWPMCLDYFEFDYYDTVYNESSFKQTFKAPFQPRMEFELLSEKIPCDDDYAFITRVYGLTGEHSTDFWTPPSCQRSTTEPTTTTPTPPTTVMEEGALEKAIDENTGLREKISGLKQQYGPIGEQVYEALKDGVYHGFEAYLARKKVLDGGDIGQIQKLAENADDPFYALNNFS